MDQFVTRADKLIEEQKNREVYSDFSNSFVSHPITGKLLKVTNENAVKQAFKNRILSNFGEKLYEPFFGSNVMKALFEPNDAFMRETINNAVKNSAQNDPRITIIETQVNRTDEYSISITVVFLINNIVDPVSINIILQRVN